MYGLLLAILVLDGFFLAVVILLQAGKGGGLAAMGGVGTASALAKFYKVPVERVIAVHDELDIAFDTLRVKKGGGDNGHNGLRSMRASLGSGEFFRVRVGIGRPPGTSVKGGSKMASRSTGRPRAAANNAIAPPDEVP